MNKIKYLKILLLAIVSLLLCSCKFIDFVSLAKQKKTTQKLSQKSIQEPTEELSIAMLEKLAALGDLHASFKLGEIYLIGGSGAKKDIKTAVYWFNKAAQNGLPSAMLRLGDIYRDGLLELPALTTAISWYEQAASLGNIQAMLNLGEIYRGWYGMVPNYNKAINIYIKAAGMGSLEAEYQIARLITNKLVDHQKYAVKINNIIQSLQQVANQGNLEAMVGLGDYYMQQPNVTLAIEYYNKSAEEHFAPALLRLGLLHFHGEGVKQDYKLAINYFTRAAKLDNVVSQYHLGEIYRQGLGIDRDAATASFWYAKACNKNFPKALVRLADLYFAGKGVEPNLYTAIDLYEKAAVLGDSYAGLLLSIFYAKGLGFDQNLPKSVHWFNLVEQKKDHLVAKFEIAKAYETGFGFNKNYTEAAKWYLLAAKNGLAKAQAKLADFYVSGLGVSKDYDQAIKWYKSAADQGYSYAQYSMALLLPQMKSYKPFLTFSLMRQAALNGYKPAQYNLALMYLQGTIVKTSAIKAYGWLSVALNDGNAGLESNPEMMNILVNNLEHEARNKAVLLVEKYHEKYKTD